MGSSPRPLICHFIGHLMSPFNIDDTLNVGVGSFENKNNETEEPKVDDAIFKDSTKAKLSEVSSKGKNKREKHSNTKLSLQDRLIAAIKDSLYGLDDLGHAYIYKTLERDFGCKTPAGYMDWLSWLNGPSVGHVCLVFVKLCIAGGSTYRTSISWSCFVRSPMNSTSSTRIRNTQVKMTVNQAGPDGRYYLSCLLAVSGLDYNVHDLQNVWVSQAIFKMALLPIFFNINLFRCLNFKDMRGLLRDFRHLHLVRRI